MSTITVWPVTDVALKNIRHPTAGKLRGMSVPSFWPDDAFTTRRLDDGDITTKPPVVAVDVGMKPLEFDPPTKVDVKAEPLVVEPPAASVPVSQPAPEPHRPASTPSRLRRKPSSDQSGS